VQQLGGKDLDAELMKIIANKFKAKTGGEFNVNDCNFRKVNIEEAKHSLSIRDKTAVRIVSGIHGPVALDITREEFEAAISHIVTQAEIACEGVLMQANLNKANIREIFMAGGTSRVPAMQRSVECLFNRKPLVKNPERAVALGASIYAALKTKPQDLTQLQADAMKPTKLIDIAPHYFGVLVENNDGTLINHTLIMKGTELPCSATYDFHSRCDGQNSVRISITQSGIEETNPEFVSIIYESNISIPSSTKGTRILQLEAHYDANGMMHCFYINLVSNTRHRLALGG
jgi:molecular chaperone DnaK (HSP70)